MKNIYVTIMVSVIGTLFSACSGGGSGGEGDASFDTGEEKITITACENYIITQENDLLIKDEENTNIKVLHDINGTKRVCTLSGSAHIIREKY